jgi:ApaG protein
LTRSQANTNGIVVAVHSRYVPEYSNPDQKAWLFAYTIRITNESDQTVQLMSRHWIITDAEGQQEEVRGPGVVGAQPRLQPGEHFEYTSACPLKTPFGTMQGSYRMVTDHGEQFDAEIAAFSLALPNSLN